MTLLLGTLTRVDLRDVWSNESQDFTPWLAQEGNLSVLGTTLNMELELEAQEQSVGPFSADILCTNTDDGSLVLIENQLERTNHAHLGQLLTYASGLHTVNIVWIAAKFTDEHRAALDWLNEITDVQFRFFGLEIELWKIGDSQPAPRFNIISKPNDWSRWIERVNNENLTPTKTLQYEYWQSLKAYGEEQQSILRFQSPAAQHWYNFGVGRTDTKLVALVNTREPTITVAFESSGKNNKAFFDLLHQDKEIIEREFGNSLFWNRRDGKNSAMIRYNLDSDINDRDQWPEFHQWMIEHLEKLDKVFRARVTTLDVSEWIEPN